MRTAACGSTFAHVCETGGGRRSWLRGTVNVFKAHLLRCAAHNLALLLRKAFGLAKPRSGAVLFDLIFRLWSRVAALVARLLRRSAPTISGPSQAKPSYASVTPLQNTRSLTGW